MSPSLEDAFASLALVEHALALTLMMPVLPVGHPVDMAYLVSEAEEKRLRELRDDAQKRLGPEFAELLALMNGKSDELRRLLNVHVTGRDHFRRGPDPFTLLIHTWAATTQHRRRRWELIEMLSDLRWNVLESMKVVPAFPETTDMQSDLRSQARASMRRILHWNEITDRQRTILESIGSERLSGKQIAERLKMDEGSLKGPLRKLRSGGILGNTPGGGYFIDRLPDGTPDDFRLRSSRA